MAPSVHPRCVASGGIRCHSLVADLIARRHISTLTPDAELGINIMLKLDISLSLESLQPIKAMMNLNSTQHDTIITTVGEVTRHLLVDLWSGSSRDHDAHSD